MICWFLGKWTMKAFCVTSLPFPFMLGGPGHRSTNPSDINAYLFIFPCSRQRRSYVRIWIRTLGWNKIKCRIKRPPQQSFYIFICFYTHACFHLFQAKLYKHAVRWWIIRSSADKVLTVSSLSSCDCNLTGVWFRLAVSHLLPLPSLPFV